MPEFIRLETAHGVEYYVKQDAILSFNETKNGTAWVSTKSFSGDSGIEWEAFKEFMGVE